MYGSMKRRPLGPHMLCGLINNMNKNNKVKTKKNYKYMHTLAGQPAMYYPGEQICFADQRTLIKLCDNLQQIKKEIDLTIKWREKFGFPPDTYSYGWVKVLV